MSHLYRKFAARATAPLLAIFLVFTFIPAQAQRPEMRRPQSDDGSQQNTAPPKKAKRGPRAIAVLEMLPGGGTRLVPVALWMDGKYFDASLYGANPAPFALEPGTVYEAQNYGETAGTFVVSMPKLVGGNWAADGQWKPYGALDAKIAAENAKHPQPKQKPSKAVFTGGPDDGPPVLRRSGSSGDSQASSSNPSSQPASNSGTPSQQPASAGQGSSGSQSGQSSSTRASTSQSSSSDSGRPTLKRPSDQDDSANSSASSSSSSSGDSVTVEDPNRPVMHRSPSTSGTTAADDDPDRPVYHRQPAPTTAAAPPADGTASAAPNPSSNDSDPERPVLTRGSQPPPVKPSTTSATASAATAAKSPKPAPGTPVRFYPAISDAGSYVNRPFIYPMTPEDKTQKAPALLALALADIRAFASKRPGPQIPKTATITDYDFRAFDLDFSNTPTLVLTAKLPVAAAGSRPFVYYATVVARVDLNGDPQKVFSSVTDTTHLDAYPRMELVDALDADANGRGDLLFRQYSDIGINYGLYRVFPYNMEKIFEGGSSL